MPAKIQQDEALPCDARELFQQPDVLVRREVMKEKSRDNPIGGAGAQRKAESVRGEAASPVEGAMSAGREVSPLQVDGDDLYLETGLGDSLRQCARRHSRTRADVEQRERGFPELLHPRNEVSGERAGRSPASVHVLEVSQRSGHVL